MASDQPIVTGVAGRYATALFELAKEAGALDAVAGDLSGLDAMLGGSADLRRLVRSPVFSAEEQERALAALTAKMGAHALTANFLRLIARNRRLFALPDMAKGFRDLLAQHRKEAAAEVVSAQPLSAQQLALLEDKLKATVGQRVRLEAKVDPALLGGLVVRIGSRMIDSSLRTKLNNMKLAMKEVR